MLAKSLYFAASSSTPIPMITRPLAAYFAWSRLRQGKEALQGPHQEAQKSTSTTLPEVFGIVAPGSSCESFGMACPAFAASAAGRRAVEQASNRVQRMVFMIGFDSMCVWVV